jgi:pimeloyl-ACP methyl ester carboxylesterase
LKTEALGMGELIEVGGCKNEGRKGDVVFLHGLDGGGRETWFPQNKPDAFWPRWLSEDVPEVGVWTLDYDSRSISWTRDTPMPLDDMALFALQTLQAAGIGQRPLMFVCHSMGGLLAKQMLYHAKNAGNEDWSAFLGSVNGICFLATPHSGSKIANWVSYLKFLATQAVEGLQTDDERIIFLSKWYRDNVGDIKTVAFAETLPMKVGMMRTLVVVDKASADPELSGVPVIPVERKDHATICKPESRDDTVYKTALAMAQSITISSDGPIELTIDGEEIHIRKPDLPGNQPAAAGASNCERRLQGLNDAELFDLFTDRLTLRNIITLWFKVFGSNMKNDLPEADLETACIELLDRTNRQGLRDKLFGYACKSHPGIHRP